MLTELENNIVQIDPSDWRWSASIVGLMKYFSFHNDFDKIEQDEDYIKFDQSLITEDKYLKFVEKYFHNKMHHIVVENWINEFDEEATEEQIKLVNEKLSKNTSSNTIMLKTFKEIKYDGKNGKLIKDIIQKNRKDLIFNTFKGGRSLYYKFCNENNLLKEKGKSCRLRGYSVDMGKKGKSVSYMANISTFVYDDHQYFDFIPFAFSMTRESFFINNNYTIKQLINSNSFETEIKDDSFKSQLFFKVKNSSNYIDYDVEIITKDAEKDYFETLYLRNKAIKVFGNISENTLSAITKPLKLEKHRGNIHNIGVNQEGDLGTQKVVVNAIINDLKLDDLIDVLLKEDSRNYLISHLIKINIEGSNNKMEKKELQNKAIASAIAIKNKLLKENKKNKLRAYEQRFISAISLKDYDRVKELLLHLSATTQQPIPFANALFRDFDENKDIAYTFINTLGEKNFSKKEGGNK